jgi:hypothetical protein
MSGVFIIASAGHTLQLSMRVRKRGRGREGGDTVVGLKKGFSFFAESQEYPKI